MLFDRRLTPTGRRKYGLELKRPPAAAWINPPVADLKSEIPLPPLNE